MKKIFSIFATSTIFFQMGAKLADDSPSLGQRLRIFTEKIKSSRYITLATSTLKKAKATLPETPLSINSLLDNTLLTTKAALIPWLVPAAIAEGLGIAATIACCAPYCYLLSIKNAAATLIVQDDAASKTTLSEATFQNKLLAIYGD